VPITEEWKPDPRKASQAPATPVRSRQDELLAEILVELQRGREETIAELKTISQQLTQLLPEPAEVESFSITQTGAPNMALIAIAPGSSPVFTATPVPAGTAPGPGLVPTWTSSDTVNAPVTADPTGLIGTVAIPTSAVVGTSFTLTVSLTNADGTVATGSASFTIVAAPSPDVTSFTIAQTT
jgi:hypothetical protein